jgi:hypothetical protein
LKGWTPISPALSNGKHPNLPDHPQPELQKEQSME